jgi:hypothetical protein
MRRTVLVGLAAAALATAGCGGTLELVIRYLSASPAKDGSS